MELVPTLEQRAAVELVKGNQFTKLGAFAGCTKTTTLMMISSEICMPSLYLAFNKAMAVEATGKFPEWVTVRTTHSFAYSRYGRALAHKLKRPLGGYVNVCGTGAEIARYFRLTDIPFMEKGELRKITAAGIGRAIRETVNAYEYSADDHIESKHVSMCALKNRELPKAELGEYFRVVRETAKKLWRLRVTTSSNILATHDTYLKVFQLSKPDLSGYGLIYLDEGQDTNDCVIDIIKRQVKSKIVVVGDRYQQIYQFRGSVNAMDKLPFVTGKLSQSFRFGPAIAEVANYVLSVDQRVPTDLCGFDEIPSVVYSFGDKRKPPGVHTILYRSNMVLVLDAVDYIDKGLKVNLEIDVKDFIKLLESAMEMRKGNMAGVKHDDLLPYSSWRDFEDEVTHTNSELTRIYKIIEDGEFDRVISVLKRQANNDHPDIIMTTAHKSKGREWDYVVLADDFPSPYNENGEWKGLPEMERNLLYVAVTRAKLGLWINTSLNDIIHRCKYKTGDKCHTSISRVIREIERDSDFRTHSYPNG